MKRARLIAAYELDPATWSAVLMTGSGTAAVESVIAGLVPEGGRLLVVENGVYGDRIAQIVKQYGIDYEVAKFEWMQAPDIDAIIARLDSGKFTNVAIIHHETTTGRLNAIDQLSRACAERGIGLLLDAVSSFGAEAIDFDGGGIAAIAATANKCLHGVPGAAFVIVRRDALAKAASRTYCITSALRGWRSCRMSAIRCLRLRFMRTTPWSRRCASSRKKAAGARGIGGMRSWPSRFAAGWRRWGLKARCRRMNRRSCCVCIACRRA